MSEENKGGTGASTDGAIERWVERWLRDARRWNHAVRLVAVLVIMLVIAVSRRRESPEASDWRANAPAIALVGLAAGMTFALALQRKFRVRFPAELARDFPIGSAGREAVLERLAPGNVARRDAAGARMLHAYALAVEAGSPPTDPRAPTPARSTEVAGAFATVVARLRAREADPSARPGAAITAWLRDWRGLFFVALVGFALAKVPTSWRTLALELAAWRSYTNSGTCSRCEPSAVATRASSSCRSLRPS